MIKYSDEEGFIKLRGIRFREDQDPSIRLPKVAVGVFSRYLFNDIIEKYSCKEVGYINNANYEKNVYIMNYKDTYITLFMAGVTGAHLCSDIEELHFNGVETVIIYGNCGVLDSKIEDCSIIIPTMAFCDDGPSHHYVKDAETITLNPEYIDDFISILNEYEFDYTKGYTWTIDAFYRETKEKINYFKNKGAICVEMEGATIAAVTKRLKMKHFTFYYAGDNLDSVEWDERSIYGPVKLDKKQKVAILALELALKLSK